MAAARLTYSFGPFQLDARSRRLTRDGRPVAIPDRHVHVLMTLLAHAGEVLSKDALIAAAWRDVAVTDNSLEQVISALRRTLGQTPDGATYIETLARRGYRFAGPMAVAPSRCGDDELAAMLAPYQALVDGRAALETLDRDAVVRACGVFDALTRSSPDYAPAHLGLANALALVLESMRADSRRDDAMLARALHHASEACRLDPTGGEAWAALSLLSHQSRDQGRAIAAAQRAAALEPDNWRHHLRLAYVSWGETRLRAAHRVLKLLPDFPFAHWLAATVHVARQAFDTAEHEVRAGAAGQDGQPPGAPFRSVGLHLLLGLLHLARGDESAAQEAFERELAREPSRHIYGRETCANSWCAMGALHLRHARTAEAVSAFERAIDAVPRHTAAIAARTAIACQPGASSSREHLDACLAELRAHHAVVEAAIAEAVFDTLTGNPRRAAAAVLEGLKQTPASSAAWAIAVDPLLHVGAHPELWEPVLTLVHSRAA
jgi:DNA-binding winged helix-turn-helix (wHTH) protein